MSVLKSFDVCTPLASSPGTGVPICGESFPDNQKVGVASGSGSNRSVSYLRRWFLFWCLTWYLVVDCRVETAGDY